MKDSFKARTTLASGNQNFEIASLAALKDRNVARLPYSFGGIVMRGTSPRDNAVYLDGIEVPIAFHFGGVTSFYPSGMLEDLSIANGNFDASYGRAQGGIVTLTPSSKRSRFSNRILSE